MNRQSVRTHFRRVGIVVSTMWSRGTGRFSLIVLGLWVLVSLVSLFWTPRSLWQTDGYNVWAKPSREHWLGTDGTGADVRSWRMAEEMLYGEFGFALGLPPAQVRDYLREKLGG